jgi:hypothetical protein
LAYRGCASCSLARLVQASHEAGTLSNKPFQQRLELSQGVRRRIVADRIRYYQPAVVDQGTTAIDHVWNITVALVIERFEERLTEALDLLAPVYDRFTEGFDTSDLIEAKALLDKLACAVSTISQVRSWLQAELWICHRR